MKTPISSFWRSVDCEHRELFGLSGEERYEAIYNLPIIAADLMCAFYKDCNLCPLYLKNSNGRNLCVDMASNKDVYAALAAGAEFVKSEVKK